MIPDTPGQMHSVLFMTMLSRAYGDITATARRRRLSEHDISTIEGKVLAMLRDAPDFAGEFTTFEVEPVLAGVLQQLEQFFAAIRAGRAKQGQKK